MKFAIFCPFSGLPIDGSIRKSRKLARKDFSLAHDTKWCHLWVLGYKVRQLKVYD